MRLRSPWTVADREGDSSSRQRQEDANCAGRGAEYPSVGRFPRCWGYLEVPGALWRFKGLRVSGRAPTFDLPAARGDGGAVCWR